MNNNPTTEPQAPQVQTRLAAKALFLAGLVICASSLISPPIALAAGIVFGLSSLHPYASTSRRLAKVLLQASVVALGFGMNLHEVLKAGRSGFVYTALGISFALLIGMALGRLLRVEPKASFLISSGTAICGGSAIAALGPVIHADDDEMAVSLGTVFVLNSIALLIFPLIGWALGLSQGQFGLWAALAIHDTSSVVGAAAKYGSQALAVGVTVKLTRALWIVPLVLLTAVARGSRSRMQLPWFIGLFCLAAIAGTYALRLHTVSQTLYGLGKVGLTVTLFLIGTGTSRAMLKKVGWRPLLQGFALWIVVAVTSLFLVRATLISI
jgi:uncharacterized integral membrane protein (TIGR00698 family)